MNSENRFVTFIFELRRNILILGLAVVVFTLGFYLLSDIILLFFQNHLDQKLAFFRVAEPFLAHIKIALFTALFTLMPAILYVFWNALVKPFNMSRKSFTLFLFFTCLLFYGGVLFCYFITLPYGVNFLLEFQSEQLRPVISIGKFISFVTLFLLAFGVIFELPVLMIFASKSGLVSRNFFEKNRRYALLVISIIAALLTPTPDIVNMMLMGVPLYVLYETGILVLKIMKINGPVKSSE